MDSIGSWLAWAVVIVVGGALIAAAVAYATYTARDLRKPPTRVLIVAISHEIADALRKAARMPAPGRRLRLEKVGSYGHSQLLLAQAATEDSVDTARKVVAAARPDYVVIAGLGRGLYPERQPVGSLIVADSLLRVEVTTPGPDDPPRDPHVNVVDGLWASRVLAARMRIVPLDPGVAYHEGAVVCCRPATTTWWTMSEDLAAVHRAAVTAAPAVVDSYATAAADQRGCAGWVGVFGVAYFAQRRSAMNDELAADAAASTIVRAATVGAFDTIHHTDSPPATDLLKPS